MPFSNERYFLHLLKFGRMDSQLKTTKCQTVNLLNLQTCQNIRQHEISLLIAR